MSLSCSLVIRIFLFLEVQFLFLNVVGVVRPQNLSDKRMLYIFSFQPFHKNQYSLSIWIITSLLNNLPYITSFSYFLLLLVIEAKREEKKTIVFYVISSLYNINIAEWLDGFFNSSCRVSVLEANSFIHDGHLNIMHCILIGSTLQKGRLVIPF